LGAQSGLNPPVLSPTIWKTGFFHVFAAKLQCSIPEQRYFVPWQRYLHKEKGVFCQCNSVLVQDKSVSDYSNRFLFHHKVFCYIAKVFYPIAPLFCFKTRVFWVKPRVFCSKQKNYLAGGAMRRRAALVNFLTRLASLMLSIFPRTIDCLLASVGFFQGNYQRL